MAVDDPLLAPVAAILSRIAGPGRTPEDVSRETRLVDGYWLDSVELLEVVLVCETTFSITFNTEHDLQSGSFETLGSLTDCIRAKLAR